MHSLGSSLAGGPCQGQRRLAGADLPHFGVSAID